MSVIKDAVARETGTRVSVCLAEDEYLDPADGGKWVTICEHGNNVQHDTRDQALGWSALPHYWCGACAAAGRRKNLKEH